MPILNLLLEEINKEKMKQSELVWTSPRTHLHYCLPIDSVVNDDTSYRYNVTVEKTHNDGWTIKGQVEEDWFEWVDKFIAKHDKHGIVWGEYSDKIYATSQQGWDDFTKNHPPKKFDKADI